MATAIQMPFECFLDTDGTPLNNGKIYIGTVNQNPITNPIAVYWDSALTIPASQPIRTLGGFPSRSGTASSVFVTDDYSIIIRNQKDVTLFSQLTGSPFSAAALLAKIKSVDGSGSGLIAEGLQSVQITDLDFDPTLLGLEVREMRAYASSNAPSNPFAGSSATYWTLYLTCVATGEFRLLAVANDSTGDVYTRNWTGGAWASPVNVTNLYALYTDKTITLTTGASPYSVAAPLSGNAPTKIILINATTNPFIVNLPAATGSGYRVKIVNTSALSTGLVRITPATGERVGTMAVNVSAYLQNVDQSGWAFAKQEIDLVDVSTGQWAIAGGQFTPEPGSVDAAGTQYFMGRYRRLPLGNTSTRAILTAVAVPAVGAFSAAVPVTGILGVPSAAKAVRMKVSVSGAATAGGLMVANIAFSDNISSNPGLTTGHPSILLSVRPVGAGDSWTAFSEIDVPLNASGQFFVFTVALTNVTAANTTVSAIAVGYWMGD